MPRRPATTILLITRLRVYRADFDRAGGRPRVSEHERFDAPDLPTLADAAFAAGPPGRTVYVLSSDFWLQSASLPTGRVVGLNADEITTALNFEAEVLSGVPALAAAAAAVPLPASGGERRFLFLQTHAADREVLANVLATHKARLGGLAHPAALPRALGGEMFAPRIELWPDAAVGVRPAGGGVDVLVSNADPATGRWQVELAAWAGAEVLTAPGIPPPPGTDPVRLESADRLGEWFEHWEAELSARKPRVPVVRPLPKPTPAGLKALLAVGLAAVVGGGLFGHWTMYQQNLADLKARTQAAADQTKQLADLETRGKAALQARDAAAKEAARVDALADRVRTQQERFARLLQAISERKPGEVLIRAIEDDHGEPKLTGLALRPDLADEYVRALTPAVRPLGWEVQPPHTTAEKLAPDGGPWSFVVSFQPVPGLTPPAPAEQPGGKK